MWEPLLKLGVLFLEKLRSPVVIEVAKVYFQDVSGRSADSIVVITPHPRRYYAEVGLTNRTDKPVYVRSIVLRRRRGKVCKEAYLPKPFRLESHEFRRLDVIFPLGDKEQPRKGQFETEIAPSVGRKSAKPVTL